MNYSELQDGLTIFIGQGAYALDCCCYDSETWEIAIYKRTDESEGDDTFTNISYMNGSILDNFVTHGSERFPTREDMLARVVQLIADLNHF